MVYIAQAVDSPASASQMLGVIGMKQHTYLILQAFN